MTDSKDREAVAEILDKIQEYVVQSALGGSPFKTEQENEADNIKAYEDGRKEAEAAICALIDSAVTEAIKTTWNYTGEGFNGEYNGLVHNGGKRYTEREVMDRVINDVKALLSTPQAPATTNDKEE